MVISECPLSQHSIRADIPPYTVMSVILIDHPTFTDAKSTPLYNTIVSMCTAAATSIIIMQWITSPCQCSLSQHLLPAALRLCPYFHFSQQSAEESGHAEGMISTHILYIDE